MKLSLGDKLRKRVQHHANNVANRVYDIATNVTPIANGAYSANSGASPVFSGEFYSAWQMSADTVNTSFTGHEPTTSERFEMHRTGELASPRNRQGFKFNDYNLHTLYVSNSISYAGQIQKKGTLYTAPDILGRIVEPFRW